MPRFRRCPSVVSHETGACRSFLFLKGIGLKIDSVYLAILDARPRNQICLVLGNTRRHGATIFWPLSHYKQWTATKRWFVVQLLWHSQLTLATFDRDVLKFGNFRRQFGEYVEEIHSDYNDRMSFWENLCVGQTQEVIAGLSCLEKKNSV